MEDSREMHSEDDKGHTGKNRARIIKTPAQRKGLEKFYQEHKYPTESMKLEVAQSLGLTEKQVSGWFCHRRLKDKRLLSRGTYANGRQDRSSGVIQDRGSGFRQDSCGSTKQGDDKNFDHREVESRRFADVTREVDTRYRAESNLMEDTPSGSTSSLRDARFSQNVDSFDMATSRYLPCNQLTDLKSVKPRTGPSGYLKVKGQVENPSITAVKRQLGSLYRQDGPPLGVEFDPLPPGAFESSEQTPVDDPECDGEPVPDLTPDFTEVYKQSNSCIEYGSISKTNSHVSDLDGASFKKSLKSTHPEYYINQKPGENSSMHNGDRYYLGRNSSIDMRKDSRREVAVDGRCNYKFMAKHDGAEIKTSPGSSGGFRSPYIGKVNREQVTPRVTSCNEVSLKIVEEEDLECKPSNFVRKGSKHRYFPQRELSSKVEKDYIHVDRPAIDENYNVDRVKIPWDNEMRAAKRVRDEARNHQEYMRKASVTRMPSQTNHQIRSAAQMPSSFSEDDKTEETSSFEG
ncbi:homeobox-DDT domain protein RLT1-like [Lycium ferocissimum]|uniref:homeobox-DDT domain protein RLT1-like n=1 Tax=Lycium ferocissimum TaxID=112874 RepID=UPI0028160F45|nr:homeobox-DDT domain protein RLT1-like [Lycium ferocissimum]XP_059286176.1 homeobox-DDT domain protein RLT1-like [Lycium ferocissimum]